MMAIAATQGGRLLNTILSILLVVMIWASKISWSLAQNLPPTQSEVSTEVTTPSRDPASVSNIPTEKINQFIQAYLQVIRLIETRQIELQSAETDSESLRIQQTVEADAFAIIEKSGLTRQEYLQLLSLANTDVEFGERIALQLQETSVE
jgi:biopolymer transport protein ExbD